MYVDFRLFQIVSHDLMEGSFSFLCLASGLRTDNVINFSFHFGIAWHRWRVKASACDSLSANNAQAAADGLYYD